MAISILNSVKNEALEAAFKPTNLYMQIPNEPGAPEYLWGEVAFGSATGGTIGLAAPVQFVVPAGTTVNFLILSVANSGSTTTDQRVAIINLEEEEIIEFENDGVYIVEELIIEM